MTLLLPTAAAASITLIIWCVRHAADEPPPRLAGDDGPRCLRTHH